MSNVIISLKDINKTYEKNKRNQCCALKNLSLDVEEGDFIAIIGKSGAGKSTLLHILSLSESYDGLFLYKNEDVRLMKDIQKSEIKNKKIGIVLQSYALVNTYTVYDNVMMPLFFGKYIKRKIRKEMTQKALERVGIENLKDKKANKISGGQRQRVAIARALINNPEIILLDEPTGALDSETANELMSTLEELNKSGTTIIMVTHDRELAKKSKRIIEIRDGEKISDTRNCDNNQ